ncbi:SHOCT domain-containing protein [Dermatobacter hominis]|uniref:SHOCT domain-containing protein n=1 Tax=Dermatobacter hominis TaxID=2884263 RepID=UPI001D0FFE69|nr:SHOCT domain-containing protein [Dermatobacter hominis]UDY34888.1 SHOCT domain-containing protein [Dermatobacter hominis]
MFAPGVFIFGVLIPLAVVALIAYGVWELARSRQEPAVVGGVASGPVASASARTILDERFARGEVDADEYVRRRALLDGTVPSPPVDGTLSTPPAGATVVDATETGPIEAPAAPVATAAPIAPGEAPTAEVRAGDVPSDEVPPRADPA